MGAEAATAPVTAQIGDHRVRGAERERAGQPHEGIVGGVGGAVELGGLKLKPNYKRADTLLHKAAKFMPALNTSDGKQWMGFRPSLPDSLPVIGPSAHSSNILYAFGHGHLGLTQSAGTAELVADLVNNATPAIRLTAYSASRF